MTQRSLLDALEPINPHDLTDRLPGADAPCICHGGLHGACVWPWCPWPSHYRPDVVEGENA